MARPIKDIYRPKPDEENASKLSLEELENNLLENKDAINQLLELVSHLEKKGLLEAMNALLAEGDQVLHILIEVIHSDGGTKLVKNLLLLVNMMGQINLSDFESLITRLNNSIEHVLNVENKKTNYVSLLKQLNDPEVQRGLSMGLAFLKGLGSSASNKQ